MPDHTDHELAHHILRRMGSADADLLHRAGRACSFLHAFLNNRGEASFTPVLDGALHRSLHPSAAAKTRQVNPIDVLKTVGLREDWHGVRAGATPPSDARCVAVALWLLPPSEALRDVLCDRTGRA